MGIHADENSRTAGEIVIEKARKFLLNVWTFSDCLAI